MTTTTAPRADDLVTVAQRAGTFNTLLAAVKAAGLADTLKGGPFTLFAPSDAAFAQLPPGAIDALLKDLPKLKSVLLYHVVAGVHMASDVLKLKTVKTAQGQNVAIDTTDGARVNDARILKTDIVASNGVIHVIDTVLSPR